MSNIVSTSGGEVERALSDGTRARMLDGFAEKTRDAYRWQWGKFEAFCGERGRVPLPASPETLAEYVASLDGYSASTIQQAIATIRSAHKTAGYRDQPDTAHARLVLRSISREHAEAGHSKRQAPPVTVEALRAMVGTCDPATLLGLRDRVVLVLGLAMMGRRSELVRITRADLSETDEGLLIRVRLSKTDQAGKGADVALPYGQHPDTCPVRVVRHWASALDVNGEQGGRLLRSVSRHGRLGASLSAEAVNHVVRARAKAAGLADAERYTAHSLRAGGATSAYRSGAPIATIAAHGRWEPTSSVVLGYIRAVDQWQDNAIRGMGL